MHIPTLTHSLPLRSAHWDFVRFERFTVLIVPLTTKKRAHTLNKNDQVGKEVKRRLTHQAAAKWARSACHRNPGPVCLCALEDFQETHRAAVQRFPSGPRGWRQQRQQQIQLYNGKPLPSGLWSDFLLWTAFHQSEWRITGKPTTAVNQITPHWLCCMLADAFKRFGFLPGVNNIGC